jgi:hypothetical protein
MWVMITKALRNAIMVNGSAPLGSPEQPRGTPDSAFGSLLPVGGRDA